MAQDKKKEENNYLNQFLNTPIGKNWYQTHNFINRMDEEHPDFIFVTQDNKRIGLEVTNFIMKSKHGRALQSLMRTGNKICKYIQDKYGFPVSILINKFDKRKYGALTKQEMLEYISNPGFIDLFNEKEIREKIEPIIEHNIEQLKGAPYFIKETIEVNNEWLTFSICGFSNIDGKFDCHVNNQCFSWEDPFKELQEDMDKKNEKFDSYLKNCDECFLLVCNPDVSKGNYCHFTDELKGHKFSYKFSNVFFYDEDSKTTICLKNKR